MEAGSQKQKYLPGIMVFHFASSVSEKNSEVLDGTNDSSAFHLMTWVVTEDEKS